MGRAGDDDAASSQGVRRRDWRRNNSAGCDWAGGNCRIRGDWDGHGTWRSNWICCGRVGDGSGLWAVLRKS
jgi:hypothetical protein